MADTRLTLRTLLRSLINEELPSTAISDTDGGFWKNGTLNNILNRAQNIIYHEIERFFIRYFMTTGTVNTTVGQNYINFPIDSAYRIERISYNGIDLNVVQAREINTSFVNTGPVPQVFYILGNKIYLSPVPTSVITLDIEYWRTPTDMSSDASVPDLPAEAHQLVAWCAAMICLTISNDDNARGIAQQYVDMKTKFLENLATAQTYDSPRVITGTSNFGLADV